MSVREVLTSSSMVCLVVLICVQTVVLSTSSSAVDAINQLEDKETCYQTCSKTYSLHTYPKSQHLNACRRGCRFSILSHVNLAKDLTIKADPQLVATKCLNSCSSAYDVKQNSSEYYACSIGCNSSTGALNTANGEDSNRPKVQFYDRDITGEQDIGSDGMTDTSDEKTDNSNRSQLFISPIHLLRSLFASIVNRGSVVVERSSMSVYLSRSSDGESKLVVVQSEPEVVVHQYPDSLQANEYDSETVTGNEERTTTDNTRPKLDLSIWTQDNPLDASTGLHKENSWSNCFSYQSGVPRWVLASILFLAIFVLAWICCATTATAPEQHIRRKIGQGSDLKYLCLYEEPVKLVIDDKLPTYEELESQKLSQKTNECNVDNREPNP